MERRIQRSDSPSEAIFYQLEASCHRAALDAMIIADENGLCVASTGDIDMCEEIAAHMALVCDDAQVFEGSMERPIAETWTVRMKRFFADDVPLYIGAVGGNQAMRTFELNRSARGVARILAE